jgi:hypothetical protein
MGVGAPCKNCSAREVGCHSTCEDYIEWKYNYNETKKEIDKAKAKERIISDYIRDATTKNKRRKR